MNGVIFDVGYPQTSDGAAPAGELQAALGGGGQRVVALALAPAPARPGRGRLRLRGGAGAPRRAGLFIVYLVT